MRYAKLLVIVIAAASGGSAQEEGMIPRWQVEDLASGIVKNVETAQKVVRALRPEVWVAKGAPEVYTEQHSTLLHEMQQVKLAAAALARQPERLTYAVDAFLWLDRVEALIGSVSGAVRRYHNSAIADLLDSARNRNADGIALLKQYTRQLAAHMEESMEVAHREAQRCRSAIISRPPEGR